MYESILVPTDGSPGMESTVARALAFAATSDATVHALAVTDTGHEPAEMPEDDRRQWRAAANAAGQAAVDGIVGQAQEMGLTGVADVREGAPEAEILGYVEEQDIDIVAMGMYVPHGESWPRLGSTTERVIIHGEVPVLAVKPGEEVDSQTEPAEQYDTVVVPTDGSEISEAAAAQTIEVAAAAGAEVHVLYVIDNRPYDYDEAPGSVTGLLEEGGEQAIENVASMARDRGLSVSTNSLRGRPEHAILSHARNVEADLIGLGTRGAARGGERIMGSTTARVLRGSSIPVLVTS